LFALVAWQGNETATAYQRPCCGANRDFQLFQSVADLSSWLWNAKHDSAAPISMRATG